MDFAGSEHSGTHRCCHHVDSHASAVPDPAQVTEQEWHDACAEATAALESAIGSINDAMDEIRYELVEDDAK